VDIHAHCAVPEALALMNLKLGGPGLRPDLDTEGALAVRLEAMDEQGINMEALSINPNWYGVDRDLAQKGDQGAMSGSLRCAVNIPIASSPLPPLPYSSPTSPPSSWRRASKNLVCVGSASAVTSPARS